MPRNCQSCHWPSPLATATTSATTAGFLRSISAKVKVETSISSTHLLKITSCHATLCAPLFAPLSVPLTAPHRRIPEQGGGGRLEIITPTRLRQFKVNSFSQQPKIKLIEASKWPMPTCSRTYLSVHHCVCVDTHTHIRLYTDAYIDGVLNYIWYLYMVIPLCSLRYTL